nr:MAG: hypothetical protein [Bacteriophage sp.]
MSNSELKKQAEEWVKSGKPCIYRYGWAYKGAGAREITTEKALELLPQYSFGVGFYELSFRKHNGQDVLEFNELSENDLY